MSLGTGLHVVVHRRSYGVAGSNARELLSVMRVLGPVREGRSFGAFTDWEVAWEYSIARVPSGVRVASAGVTVRATILVPRWRPARGAPAELVEQWRKYVEAVEAHEQGHVHLAIRAGCDILAALEGLPPFAQPEELRAAVQVATEGCIAAARGLEVTYDEVSNHGATHGARLCDPDEIHRCAVAPPAAVE